MNYIPEFEQGLLGHQTAARQPPCMNLNELINLI